MTNDNGCNSGCALCTEGRAPLPEQTVPAMAYVPFQQWGALNGAEDALAAGTLFPVLDKPFLAGRRDCDD